MPPKLTDLNPHFLGSGGEGVSQLNPATGQYEPAPKREGVGVQFDCPCGCEMPCYVPFENPLDGGKPLRDDHGRPLWARTGDTFETLTLTPSILRSKERGGCGWHGFVTNGEVRTV